MKGIKVNATLIGQLLFVLALATAIYLKKQMAEETQSHMTDNHHSLI
ncbi:MAG: hypothetical protein K2P81_05680 [Bacteriovoracaceae bacterium]|nr:hypothetical protein [Bacteriovoracaceae bacterium]